MKKHLVISTTAVLGLSAGAALISTQAGSSPKPAHAAISAPMRTELLPGIPAPATAGQVEAFMAAANKPAPAAPVTVAPAPHIVTSFTTTAPVTEQPTEPTEPTAVPGPQPYSPGVTTAVTTCLATWPEPNNPGPNGEPTEGGYQGDCATADQMAALNPGSTVQTITQLATTSAGELPGT